MPVFVLGLQRSGTTWVANMLAGSGAVAAVAAAEHRGVHESIFFSHFARAFGSFDDPAARRRFQQAFAQSDYFLLTGLSEAFLDEIVSRAQDYADVFAIVMEEVATRTNCDHWLEKSPHHTLLADELAARFPAAKFVCITRSSMTLIASRLAAYGRVPSRGMARSVDILRGALVNALYTRFLEDVATRLKQRAMLVRYDDLVADLPSHRRGLVAFLGLQVDPDLLESKFSANTSHDRRDTRQMSSWDRALIRVGDWLGRVLPLSVLSKIEQKRRKSRGIDWPDWVWMKSGYKPD
ncbi:sulfotransferase family protein [Marivita sp. S2033]|uniref:sulfotransferase family protein n=1 Tax=Marivita sp. S2033 TaxID=3373187 RepID=UPI003981E9FF